MTYETAAYLKLLLHGGLKETYFFLMDEMLEHEDVLEGILLELSYADDDTQKAITCLARYLSGQRVDYDSVADRLLTLVWNLLDGRSINQSEAVSALCCMAENTECQAVEPWHSMLAMENYYCLAVQGDVDADRFNEAFFYFLTQKVPFFEQISGANSDWKRIVARRREDKARMTRIGFFLNHIAPYIDLALLMAVLTASAALLDADASRYQTVVCILVGGYVLFTAILFALGPLVRSGRLETELKRLQLDGKADQVKERYVYHVNGQTITIDRVGMTVDKEFFRLENLEAELDTSGKHARVSLRITLRTRSGRTFQIPLCPDSLAMIESFSIRLENQSELDYLLRNRRQAMQDILKYGALWPDRHKQRKP